MVQREHYFHHRCVFQRFCVDLVLVSATCPGVAYIIVMDGYETFAAVPAE